MTKTQTPAPPQGEHPAAASIHRPLEWRIRAAGPDDCAAIALVAQATFLETYAALVPVADLIDFCARQHSPEAYRGFLAEGGDLWLAEEAMTGAPLGYALLTTPALGAVPDDDTAFHPASSDSELRRIYVLSRCQGLGLAGRLMDRAMDRARALGRTRLVLGVHRGNARALAFYARHGFTPVGTRRFVVATAGYDDFILARPLDA